MARNCLLVLLMAVTVLVSAEPYQEYLPDPQDDSGWTLALDRQGIAIYTRRWPGSDFVAVKLKHHLQTSLSSFVGNYLSIETMNEWVKEMKENRLIREFDVAGRRIVYIRMDLPWPLNDRDMASVQQVWQDAETRVVTIREKRAQDAVPPVEGVVRIPRGQSEFTLTPVKDGVDVIWQGHNEPGGVVPAFLTNWMIEEILFESTLNMRQRFEDPAHAMAYPGIVD